MFRLHQEIEEFYDYMTASREEHELRLKVINNVKSIILSLWPKAQVEVFGSFKTSLYLPTRYDISFFFNLNSEMKYNLEIFDFPQRHRYRCHGSMG